MKKKIVLIGSPSNIDKYLEVIKLNFKGEEIEIVSADSADLILNVDQAPNNVINLSVLPDIPHIAFELEIKEKRKGYQRPYKYHK